MAASYRSCADAAPHRRRLAPLADAAPRPRSRRDQKASGPPRAPPVGREPTQKPFGRRFGVRSAPSRRARTSARGGSRSAGEPLTSPSIHPTGRPAGPFRAHPVRGGGPPCACAHRLCAKVGETATRRLAGPRRRRTERLPAPALEQSVLARPGAALRRLIGADSLRSWPIEPRRPCTGHTGAMVVRRRRRWWWIAAGAVVLVAATAFVLVRFVFLRDTTTTVSPGDVLARYRASSTVAGSATTTAGSGLALPAPGVYRYATTGTERVDALGGATHTYPAVTTITVTPAGCGVQARWDALQERWNLRELCLGDGGIVSGSYTDVHRFYGQTDRSDWTCAPAYVLVPGDPMAGAAWTGSCTDGHGTSEATAVSVMGLDDVTVARQPIPAVHVQRVETDTGSDTTATSTTDQWFDRRTGLVLREVATSSSTTSSLVGDVHYQEQYELAITS